MLIRLAWLCIIICLSLAAQVNVLADNEENTLSGSPEWISSSAPPVDFDWIQLSSGEWLKGDLKRLYQEKLEFESDKLDLLEFDWEDVEQVHGHQPHSVLIEGSVALVGILKIVDDEVYITTSKGVYEFDRRNIISIATGAEREINRWTAKVAFNFNLRKGNSDQVDWSTTAKIRRRTAETRFVADYLGIYHKTDGEETANSQRFSSYYDVFKTRKFYWRPVSGEYFRDPFSNTRNRVTVGTGIGYYIINTKKTDWDITPAFAYQYLQYQSVEPGQDTDTSTPALVVETIFDTELTKSIDFNASYKFQIVNQESGRYNHHSVTALEFEVTRWLDLNISFIWDRIQNPQPGEDGTVPKKDDFYLFLGIGFDL